MSSQTTAQQHELLVVVAFAAAAAAQFYHDQHFTSIPFNTLALTGQQWVEELLEGHPERMHENLGVRPHVFHRLCQSLCELSGLLVHDTRWVDIEEQVAICLYFGSTNLGICKIASGRFNCSKDTVAKDTTTP